MSQITEFIFKGYEMKNYMTCEFCRTLHYYKKLKPFQNLVYCNTCIKKVLALYKEGIY